MLALVGGLLTAGTAAEAAPEQVLQSVEVELGSDGTVRTISSDAVRRAEGSDPSVDEASFDPAEKAAELPVRILTSYRLGDRVGTDLADIEGESGRVVVEVTVQNTTVRPQELSFDSGGVQKSQYALVGTPLTVIASAALGKDSLGRVVTVDDGAPGVTNGVLSRSEDGGSQVQWAAMLAPPRLASSATFTLVQETDDFEVPSFDFSVQPGLVTDGSIQNLLRSAFSEDESSTLRMESQTIELIGDVNAVLTEAGSVLGTVQQGLAGTASQLGRKTISDLEASTSAVSDSLLGVATDINGLESSISSTLEGTSSRLLGQLDATLGRVKGLLGDPQASAAPEPVVQSGKCEVALPGYGKKKLTIYEQILQVNARLTALKSASAACGQVIEADLLKSIGDEDVDSCTPASTSVTCAIQGARASLGAEAEDLVKLRDGLLDLYDLPAVARLSAQADNLAAEVASVQAAARGLAPAGEDTALDDPLRKLAQLDQGLVGLQGLLQAIDLTELLGTFGEIETVASGQVTALGAVLAGDTLSVTQAIKDLLSVVCEVPDDPDDPDAAPRGILAYLGLARTECGGALGLVTGLLGDVTQLVNAVTTTHDQWKAVAGLADVDEAVGDIDEDVTGLEGTVQDLRKDLAAVRDSLGTNPDGGVVGRVRNLADGIRRLYAPDAVPGACPPAPTVPESPVNAIIRSAKQVECNSADLGDRVTDKFGEVTESIDGSASGLGDTIRDADTARQAAVKDVQRLTQQLGQRMTDAGREVRTQGRQQIDASRGALDARNAAFGEKLNSSVGKVLDQIGATVLSANRSLLDSERQLRDDLQRVLVDLGDPETGSSGILGALRTNASQTGLSTRRIAFANNRAVSFGNVRTQALDDVYLQQAQLGRSLEMQEAFGSFGLDLPGGSRVLTVFSFHLGES